MAEKQAAEKEIQAIGAGLPRTGTTSLWTALEILGVKPVHSFRNGIGEDPFPYREVALWVKAFNLQQIDTPEAKAERQAILRYIYHESPRGPWTAAIDYPNAPFLEDLIEMYPNALIIHTCRSSSGAWKRSIDETVGRCRPDNWQFRWISALFPFTRWSLFPLTDAFLAADRKRLGVDIYGDQNEEAYHRHNAWVRKVAPKDRVLLDFEPGMGWEPLCKFLNVPIPMDNTGTPIPYPKTNERDQMQRGFKIMFGVGFVTWGLAIGLVYAGTRWIALPLAQRSEL